MDRFNVLIESERNWKKIKSKGNDKEKSEEGGVYMHSCILKGITTALLVTILTLCAGIAAGALGFSGLNISGLVDIGLLLSCLIGGYRAGAGSGEWLSGGITGAGYVAVGTLLLALFFPIRVWGFIQVRLILKRLAGLPA